MASNEARNATGGAMRGGPSTGGGHEDLIRRLDAARATLEEAASVCEEIGNEDAYLDARMAFHIAGEVAGVIEEHDEKPRGMGAAGGNGETTTEEG